MGSVRGAGRHLGVAQPALTRSIREVEAELGVPLFERHAKGVRLTTLGAAFLRRAHAVNAELRRARDEINQMRGGTTGEVSLALSTATAMALMPRVLTKFRERFPDAVLKISESLLHPIEAELIDGTIDLYAGPVENPAALPQLDIERLFQNSRMVVARLGHPLAKAVRMAELKDVCWVRPTLSTRGSAGDFDAVFEDLGIYAPKIVLHARSALITLIAVANSDLMTILPQQWLEFPPTRGMLAPLPIAEPMLMAPVSLVRRRDLPLTPMAEYLCDLLRRSAGHYASAQAAAEGSPESN